jgi:geranylgeranyl diphosphate synthase type I
MAGVKKLEGEEIAPNFGHLQGVVSEYLRTLLAKQQGPLYPIMEYALGWRDQDGGLLGESAPMLERGCFCLLVCRAVGGEVRQGVPVAGAVELLHSFSMVHDDIQNGAPEREGRSAVWWLWGPAQGINVGDGLHALARLSLFGLEEHGISMLRILKAARILDEACLKLFEGQYEELLFQEQTQVLPRAYFSAAEKRAGALWSCAAGLGALVAGADDETLALCQQGGMKFGVACQIQQEILEFWNNGEDMVPGGAFLNKRKSLPVIYALTSGEPQIRRELTTLYLQRVLEPKMSPRVIELLDQAGSKQYCENIVNTMVQESLHILAQAGIHEESLVEFRQLAELLLGSYEDAHFAKKLGG